MANVALRGLPDDVHAALREAAERNHRSLNGEIVARLEASVRGRAVDVEALLARVRRRGERGRLGELDVPAIDELVDAGRA